MAFVWGDGGSRMTPEQIAAQQKIAQAMMMRGADYSPVQHYTQGMARVAESLVGGLRERGANEASRANAASEAELIASLMPQAATPAATGPVAGNPAMAAQPMGALPRASSRLYDQTEMNPMDAAVATPQELAVGVPAPKQYASLIGKAAIDNDLPAPLLAAQIKQESGFNPLAVSPVGAAGISQFMPGTAKEMGVSDPFNPEQAIPAGARYLRQQVDRFDGSVPLGLAAYNAGPGRVAKSGGDISRLPAETQGYVANITGAAGQPAAAPPVAAVAAAMPPGVNPKIMAAMASPYVSDGTKKILGMMLQQQMTTEKPTTVDLGNEVGVMKNGQIISRIPKSRDPMDTEAKTLDLAAKRKGLEASPTVQRIKQPDGSEVAVQWDPENKTWAPLKAPEGGNPVANPKLTEQQSKDVGFYNRGSKILPRLELQDQALTDIYSAGGSQISNYLKTDSYRQAEQTGRELLAVILRKDTGAAVTPSEMEQYGSIYLPKPGDDPATIQQKRASRATAMEGLRMGLGPAEIIFKSREAMEMAKAPEMKTIGNKQYYKENGQWFEK